MVLVKMDLVEIDLVEMHLVEMHLVEIQEQFSFNRISLRNGASEFFKFETQ